MNMYQMIAISLVEFALCALALVVVMKNARLRSRASAGLHIALDVVGRHFRSSQIVNVPGINYRDTLRASAITGLLSNPDYKKRGGDLISDANEIVEAMLDSQHSADNEPEIDDDGPNYSEDDQDGDADSDPDNVS